MVSAYLYLKKVASSCHHPIVIGQEKAACTEQVELVQSHLTMVHIGLDAL